MTRPVPPARLGELLLALTLLAAPACDRWETELPADTLWSRPLGGSLAVASGDLFVLAPMGHPGLAQYASTFTEPGYPPVLVRLASSDGHTVFARQLQISAVSLAAMNAGPDLAMAFTESGGLEGAATVGADDGMVRWSTRAPCTRMNRFNARPLAAIDAAGAIVMAVCDGNQDVLQKWSPVENRRLWSRPWRQAGEGYATDLAVGDDGDITFAARFYNTVDAGLGPLVTEGGEGHLIARFSGADGQPRWAVAVAGDMTYHPFVGLGPGGQVAISGAFTGKLIAGAHHLGASYDARGNQDVYVAGLSADGVFQWVQALRGADFDHNSDVVVLPDGKVVASLNFGDYIAFGGSAFRAREHSDVLLAAFDGPTGRALRPRALLGSDGLWGGADALAADGTGRTFATNGSVTVALPPP